MAGDFPITVLEVSGGHGTFTGRGFVHIPFLGGAKFKVVFDNISLNSDGRLIRGFARTVYKPSEGGIANLDDVFEGGATTGNPVNGITRADVEVDFGIGEDSDFYFDSATNKVTVTDDKGNVIGHIEASGMPISSEGGGGNNGNEPSVFPMTVKDKDGNLYRVEKAPADSGAADMPGVDSGTGSSTSDKKLKVTPLGKTGAALPAGSVNYERLDYEMAEVVFTDVPDSRYAFDQWEDVYGSSLLIRDNYERMGMKYYVSSKLLPSGKSDKVGAQIKVADTLIVPSKVVFMTPQGTEFKVESFDPVSGRYVLYLTGGDRNNGQEVYALHPKKGGGYYNLGKLLVVSYPEYTLKVKLVPVSNDMYGSEFSGLQKKLREIYGRIGVTCQVEKDAVFGYQNPTLFDGKSGLLSAYNAQMKALNIAYASERPVDGGTSYLFVLLYSSQGSNRDYTGFMPRGCQFGYLFRKDFKSAESFYIAAAHELGHGRLCLKHTFDKSYGLPAKSTTNLMDYTDGTHFAKWQWDLIHDPGVVVRIFEKDKDGMLKGAFYDGIALAPLVDYKYHYNFGDIYSEESRSSDVSSGKYSLNAHYNSDVDNTKKLSYYLAWREIDSGGSRQFRSDYYIGKDRLADFQQNVLKYERAADVFYLSGKPSESMLKVLCGLEVSDLSLVLGGLGDMWGESLTDPMWWMDIVNSSVAPKFMKPAGKFVGGFVKELGSGGIKLLDKCGKLGYKIKHVAGEVALYTNLEVEIARFNSKGHLRPLYWGEAVGEKVLQLEDDIPFLKDGKELSGKLAVYKLGNKYVWAISNVSFKVGDKIAGISIERIKPGKNNKIAIIGRVMGNEEMRGVRDVYNEFKNDFHIEIFDQSSLTGKWLSDFRLAQQEMNELSKKLGRYLNNAELVNTKMYQLNREWAKKIIEEDCYVIDLGDITSKEGNYKGFSAFYAIEKKIIFEK